MLREWRARRGFSQLDVSHASGISVRHLSFVETGRAKPTKGTLLAIAETLDIPLRERNRLLEAAGLAAAYAQTSLEAAEMAHLREVLQFLLNSHEPFAALVLELAELHGYSPGPPPMAARHDIRPDDLLLPVHIRKGDIDLRIYSAIMTLGMPRDVLLQAARWRVTKRTTSAHPIE